MSIQIIDDKYARENLDMKAAVRVIENILKKVSVGNFLNPPRHYVKNDNGAIAFTIGGDKADGIIGFRAYDTFPSDIAHEQFVAVYNAKTGQLNGIVTGDYIGAARTGAIGGVAIDQLSKKDSSTVGIIGSGAQARTQLQAAMAVRQVKKVRCIVGYLPMQKSF